MADQRMGLLELLRKAGTDGDVDFLREGVRLLAEGLMEAEVTELTGVPHGERDPGQCDGGRHVHTQGNGHWADAASTMTSTSGWSRTSVTG